MMSDSQEDCEKELEQKSQAMEKWWAALGIGISVFMFALDLYIVNLALPSMVESFSTSFSVIQWLVLSYLLTSCVFVLIVAKLGDTWSKKWLYVFGQILFTISSLLCALAPSISWLIVFRGLQGLGAAFLTGLGSAIIVEVFPPEQRGLGLGIRNGAVGMGIMLGPSVGGLLMNWGGWPSIFWINVPIGIIGTFLLVFLVPPSSVNGTEFSFDAIGAFLLGITLTCFTLGMTLLESQDSSFKTILILLVTSIISLTCFLGVEAKLSRPMLDLKIFRSQALNIGLLIRFMGNFVMAGTIFILPFFLEMVKGYPIEEIGLLLAVPSLIVVFTSPLAGSLADRFGERRISLIGVLLMASGCWFISTFNAQLTVPIYITGITVYGLGIGVFQSSNNSAIMGATPQESLSTASGLLALSRMLGEVCGVPLMGTVFSFVIFSNASLTSGGDVTHAPPEALVLGLQTTFRIVACVLIASVILITLFERSKQEPTQTQ